MCKYCKHLQELRKEDQRTIERWKKYCYRQEKALEECMVSLGGMLVCPDEIVVEEAWEVLQHCSKILHEDTIR